MLIHSKTSANFREIRMGGIGPGTLYRSSHPIEDDRQDKVIAKLAVRARIATILNLADTDGEMRRLAISAPWYRKILNADGAIALGINFNGMSLQFCTQLRRGIRFMLRRPGPYLVHCYAGVDRTGFVAIVLEALMGATLCEIIDDYLKSLIDEELLAPHDSPQYQLDSVAVYEILTTINNGKPVTDENVKAAAENYLVTKIGLTVPELESLKERLAKDNLQTTTKHDGLV
jgi:hypothetical protein